MTLHMRGLTSRRLAVGAVTMLALAGCSKPSVDDTDTGDRSGSAMVDAQTSGTADGDDTDTEGAPTTDAQTSGTAQSTTVRSVCETVPAVVEEDTILRWIDARDNDDIRGAECEEYEEFDPVEAYGFMSRYMFVIGDQDWVDGDPSSSTTFHASVTDRETAARAFAEGAGSPEDDRGYKWASPERDVAVMGAERLEFTDTAGRTFDATGSQVGVAVYTESHIVEFALPYQHPSYGRSIEPVVVNGEVNPLYAGFFGDLLVATLVE